jgi:tetratricopeptide (TPR) repeat protein
MGKQNAYRPPSSSSIEGRAVEAEAALRLGRFKDAIELYKQILKQENRPAWRDSLATAYVGRAKALAAKGLFKEAEVVFGNAISADGAVREPLFLLSCLISQGQHQKALAQALKYVGTDAVELEQKGLLSDLAAALYLAHPVPLAPSAGDPPARVEWIAAAHAAGAAWAGLAAGEHASDIETRLAAIPARSPFGPARLIVKALLSDDPAKARRLLEGVPADSPFGPFRLAVEATLPAEPADRIERMGRASPAQRGFALACLGASGSGPAALTRLIEAERGGPAALFAFLTKQTASFPAADVRNACLNLLPLIPDRIAVFERGFGPLAAGWKDRVLALAAEAKQDWRRAEEQWSSAARLFAQDGSRDGKLSAGVIYRHLADLANKTPEIVGDDPFYDPVAFYLRESLGCDPEHLASALRLIKRHRENGEEKDWHTLAEETARLFPTDSAALLEAIDSAAARKAYKKAAGYAKKLLAVDPINRPARQRMIALQIAHARKQMRAKRADLAWKALADANEWERADAPSADLRINQGLVGLRGGFDPQAETRLREGVALAGGGAPGWFRAALQDSLATPARQPLAAPVAQELAAVLREAPSRANIVAVAALFAGEDVRADPKGTIELVWRFGNWVRGAARVELSMAEFHAVAEAIVRAQLFDVLRDFSAAGLRREPGERLWRFYEIVARTQNNPDWMYQPELDEIDALCALPAIERDRHARARIDRYLDGSGDDPRAKRRARRRAAHDEADEVDAFADILRDFMDEISPREIEKLVRARGRDGAAAALVARMAKAPESGGMPRAIMDFLAKTMIAMALGELDPDF